MNSMRSLVRQAAKPLAYNSFAKRTISSSRAALSDALFVVNDRHILLFFHTLLIYSL
jgi:NADH dehydrogenase (ubiquinone) flavoprotein 2